jgi:hypothetical protein
MHSAMETRRLLQLIGRVSIRWVLGAAAGIFLVPLVAQAQARKKNPVSKVYVSDVGGEATIDTGEEFEDLRKRSVYTAQGTVVETKAPPKSEDKNKYYSTMVYSNGTGAFFDADTRVEVRRFVQEPFTPNRTDVELEPSISQTQAFLARGTVGLCNSKLVAGSNMVYQTPHGSVNIRGRKVVIEAGSDVTKISMLEGESTVRGGTLDMGGHMLHTGEQAIIRRSPNGQANQVEIQRIPSNEATTLDNKVAMACMARKTVYFDVRERQLNTTEKGGDTSRDGGGGNTGGNDNGTGGNGDGIGGSATPNSPVTAFDGSASSGGKTTVSEIVPVEVIPTTLPVEFTVSPARITTPERGPGG